MKLTLKLYSCIAELSERFKGKYYKIFFAQV